MQNFAINGGTLNGDPEVWIDASSASVVFQADGDGMRGAMGAGTAQCSIVSAGTLALQAKLEGVASVAWAASGSITYGVSLTGYAPLQLNASLQGVRWAMLEGQAPTEFYTDVDLQVVPSISATFVIALASELDLHVATGQHGEGLAPIEVRSAFEAKVAKAFRLEGVAPIEMAGIGYGRLVMQSPPGEAVIAFASSVDTRMGEQIKLEGYAPIEISSRGEAGSFKYVFLESEFDIEVRAQSQTAGRPNIPDVYTEAPRCRRFKLCGERRYFVVPIDRNVIVNPEPNLEIEAAAARIWQYANYSLPTDVGVV